jgi:hypothetical protein
LCWKDVLIRFGLVLGIECGTDELVKTKAAKKSGIKLPSHLKAQKR